MDEKIKLSIELVIAFLNNAEKEVCYQNYLKNDKERKSDLAVKIKRKNGDGTESVDTFTLNELMKNAYMDISSFEAWTKSFIKENEERNKRWADAAKEYGDK